MIPALVPEEWPLCKAAVEWPPGRKLCYLPADDAIHHPAEECEARQEAPCPKPEAHHEYVP